MPSTLAHGKVVGGGVGRPQRTMTATGSPHAAVDWAFTERRGKSCKVSGNRTIMFAQWGLLAPSAGSKATVGAHPVRTLAASRTRDAGAKADALTESG